MDTILPHVALIVGGVFALVLLLCGALLVGIGLFTLSRYRAAAGWPQAPAVIEASEVATERHFAEAGAHAGPLYYRPMVRYRYSTPGGSFVGDKLATTGKLYPKEAAARRVVDRYPVGTSVVARYNPADPAEAVLERGGAGGGFAFLLFGLFCWIGPVVAGLQIGLPVQALAAILGALVLIPTVLLLRSRSGLAAARQKGLCPPAGSATDADVAALAARGEKILAICLYRELHGGGLKDARQAVEALAKK